LNISIWINELWEPTWGKGRVHVEPPWGPVWGQGGILNGEPIWWGVVFPMERGLSEAFTHRNLKPENILLDWNGNWIVRIADFGHSAFSHETFKLFKIDLNSAPQWPVYSFLLSHLWMGR
jgi:serine/threonine protein kinase